MRANESCTATSSGVVARTVRPSSARSAVPVPGLDLPERAEEDVRDGAVHRLRHQQREQGSGGADEHAGDDQDGVREHEARRGGGKAGGGVEQRDHDRHVGAADRQDEEDPEEDGQRDEEPQHPLVVDPGDERDPEPDRAEEDSDVEDVLAGERDRPAAEELLQLRERDERAGERDRADQRREHGRDAIGVVVEVAVAMWNSASATSAAAPPPTPLNRATICGIAVIFTLRAPTTPTAAPIAPR